MGREDRNSCYRTLSVEYPVTVLGMVLCCVNSDFERIRLVAIRDCNPRYERAGEAGPRY